MPLKLTKRGNIWHYTGTVAGRRLRGSTKTALRDQAEKEANKAERRQLEGRRDPGSVLTFAQAAIEYRKGGKAPKYLTMVEDFWKDTLVKDITRGAIRKAANTLLPSGSGAYKNRAVIVPTQAVINYASDELELCSPIHVKRFHEPKHSKEPATREWIEAFMAHSSYHLGALACFMFGTGARISEALQLTWEDVDLQNGRATIAMGKLGGEERRARLPPAVVAALANIGGNRDPDARVFPYAAYDSVRKPWDAAVKRAGIKKVTPHGCRHGFATGLMHAGVDPITVAKRGGWKSPAQLFKTYGHAMDDETVADRLFDTPMAHEKNDVSQVIELEVKSRKNPSLR